MEKTTTQLQYLKITDKLPYFDKISIMITYSANFLVVILSMRKFVIILLFVLLVLLHVIWRKTPFPERKEKPQISLIHLFPHDKNKSSNPLLCKIQKPITVCSSQTIYTASFSVTSSLSNLKKKWLKFLN